MSYDPPTGRELQLLKVYETLEEASYETSIDIGISHTHRFALDGVRTNGVQHLTSLSTYRYQWQQKLVTIQKDVQALIRNYRKVKKIHAQMERDIKRYFRICERCRGKGGYKNSFNHSWEDCSHCCGRGLIEKQKRRK